MRLKQWFKIVGGVIGAVFLGLLLLPHINHSGCSPEAYARVEVSQLSCALKTYRTEFGAWPTGNQARLMKTLLGDNSQKITFYDVPLKSLNQRSEFVDPWGVPFLISFSNDEPQVTSAGPNKQFGDKDDICSWK